MALPSTGSTEIVESNTKVVDSNTEVVDSNTEVVDSNTGIVDSGIEAAKLSLRAGSDFITTTMAPALEPLKAAGAALGNPLQALNAPPIVMAAAAAAGTMFSGFGSDEPETSGSDSGAPEVSGSDSESPEEQLKTAGEELSESSVKLDESVEGLVALSSVLGFENIEIILEDIRDSSFGAEKAIEKIQEWAGKIFRELGGEVKRGSAPQGQVGGIGGGFREVREKVDPTARLRAIEEKREAALAAKKGGGEEGEGEGEEKELDNIFHPLDFLKGGILKLLSPVTKFFSGIFAFFGKIVATAKVWGPKLLNFGKGFGKILGKAFWPITALLAAVAMITGFIDEFKKEGDIVESVKAGLVSVIDNLIDLPINLIKDMVAWIAGALGFEEFEKTLNSFDFDFSGAYGKYLDFIDPIIAMILSPVTAIQDFIKGFQEGGLVEGMVQMYEGFVENIIDAPLNWIKGLVASVLKFFGFEKSAKALDDLPDIDISGGVREMVENIAKTLKAVFTNIWVNAKETLMTLFDKVKKLFTIEGMIQAIEGLVETMIDAPLNMIKDTASAILKFFGFEDAASDLDSIPDLDLSGKVREMVETLWENIKKLFTIEGMIKAIEGLVENIIDAPLNWIKDTASSILKFFGFDDAASDLDNIDIDLSGKVRGLFETLWENIKKLFTIEGMIQAIEGVVETMIDAPLNWIKDLVSGVLKFFGFEDAASGLDDIDIDLSGGIRGMFEDIKAVFNNIWVNAKESLTAAWENIKGFFTWKNIKSIMGKGDSMFANFISGFGGDSEEETGDEANAARAKEGPGVLGKMSSFLGFGGDSEEETFEKMPEGMDVNEWRSMEDSERKDLIEAKEGPGVLGKMSSFLGFGGDSEGVEAAPSENKIQDISERDQALIDGDDEKAIELDPRLKKRSILSAARRKANMKAKITHNKNLGVQEPAEGVGTVAKVVEESALQASERTAAAESGGTTVVNAPSNSTHINNESTQTMIAAPRAIIRGQGNIEGAGLQLS